MAISCLKTTKWHHLCAQENIENLKPVEEFDYFFGLHRNVCFCGFLDASLRLQTSQYKPHANTACEQYLLDCNRSSLYCVEPRSFSPECIKPAHIKGRAKGDFFIQRNFLWRLPRSK
jgi:hypothetical protein